jgi:uncharacterized protein YceH (UPF0502 family)
MTAIPANNPIAAATNGMPTPPWLKWFTLIQSQINSVTAGAADTTAREMAADAEALASQVAAYVAALEQRVAALETQVAGVV